MISKKPHIFSERYSHNKHPLNAITTSKIKDNSDENFNIDNNSVSLSFNFL